MLLDILSAEATQKKMIKLVIDRGRCIGERTCGHCKYYLDPLIEYMVVGGNYAFALADLERCLPEIEAAISSCEWGAIRFDGGIGKAA